MGNGVSAVTTNAASTGRLPPPAPPPAGTTHLRHCATLTGRCLQQGPDGEYEILATKFLMAGSSFVQFIEQLGPFAAASSKELLKNLNQIMIAGCQRTMRELLDAERQRLTDQGKDPFQMDTALVGTVWVVRTMRFWEVVCSQRMSIAAGEVPDPLSFQATLADAYEKVVKVHLNVAFQKTFEAALRMAPRWEEVRENLVPEGGTDADFAREAAEVIPQVSQVTDKLEVLMSELYPGQYQPVALERAYTL